MAESTVDSPRHVPAWEAGPGTPARRFQTTLLSVLRSPRYFFRTLSIHGDIALAEKFGVLTLIPTIIFNSKTFIIHYLIMMHVGAAPQGFRSPWVLLAIPLLIVPTWMALYSAVVYLTGVESRYWGMRLPTSVIRRALPYVGAHAAMISLLPLAVVSIYGALIFANDNFANYLVPYLFVLSGAVVFAALYLFSVYWRAMRSLMNANR